MLSPRAIDPPGRRVLVLEPNAEGHSQEWLQHLMEYTAADERAPALYLAVPETLCRALEKTMPAEISGRIHLMALTPRELQLCNNPRLSLAAFARWWTMRRYLRQSVSSSGFFLALDFLSLPLALGLGAGGKPLSGILFRPSVHYGSLGSPKGSLRERLRDLRKNVLYRLMLRNPALHRVLSLDPFFPPYAAKHYGYGRKVQALPDPAPHILAAATRSHEAVAELPAGRLGFLLFGYLTERKGPLVLIQALEKLPPPIAARIAVLIAGRVDPAIRDLIAVGCRRLGERQPELWLHVDDRRQESAELQSLVMRNDVILVPYQRFVGSSGVLLWAANAGRPVLAQDYGLVGRLTRDHRLGLAADCSDPTRLAAAIVKMVERGPQSFIDRAAAQAFVQSRSPARFAAMVLVGGKAESAISDG